MHALRKFVHENISYKNGYEHSQCVKWSHEEVCPIQNIVIRLTCSCFRNTVVLQRSSDWKRELNICAT